MTSNTSTQIIRQSQIKTAMEIFSSRQIQPSVVELVAFTEALTDYIINGTTKDTMDKIRKVDEWLNTKSK